MVDFLDWVRNLVWVNSLEAHGSEIVTDSVKDTRNGLRAVNTIMAGVLFLCSLAILLGNGLREWAVTGLLFFVVSMLFGSAAYGLAKNRAWAITLTFILVATFVIQAVFDPGLLRSPALGIFWLMILAAPFAAYLAIVQFRAWLLARRQNG